MKKNKYLLMLFFGFLFFTVSAQVRVVSGNVVDEEGLPMIAATVRVVGTQLGAITDVDGNFIIENVPSDATQVSVSYTGYQTKVLPLSDNMNVAMEINSNELEGVVVTALGIERKPKELSYSVASLSNDEMTKTSSNNVATAMIGKVSGMQINTSNNSVNPSTRIVLRGDRSILGNNQALVVIDGVPSSRYALDRLNNNDIAEITVLKGANASALYGSEATNGVVLVTTKKGSSDKLNVQYTGSYQIDNVSFMPKFQDQFGAGGFPDGTLYPLENVNWGPRFDGRLVDASETYEDGSVWQVPFSPIKDLHKSFFDQGVTANNGITLSSGNQDRNVLLSFNHSNTNGIVPKDKFNRSNFRFKAEQKFDKLKVGGNLSFYRSNSNTVGAGRQGRPLYWTVINTPLHLPLTKMKNWRDGKFTRNETSFFRFYENPYYIIDTKRRLGNYSEFNAIADLNYEFSDKLNVTLRSGYTKGDGGSQTKYDAYKRAFTLENAYFNMAEYGASASNRLNESKRFNNDLILNYTTDLTDDWKVDVILGNNVRSQSSSSLNISGSELIVPNFYDLDTRKGELNGGSGYSQYRKIGAYGNAVFGFKDYLFVTLTGRNDWSSALPKNNRSFFYSGGGVSFVPTDAFPNLVSDKGLSYLKTNLSYAKTGNDPTAYQINPVFFTPSNFPYGNVTGLAQSSTVRNPNINPEFTTSLEGGIEYGLFKERLLGTIALFKSNSIDQILPITAATSSGARSYLTNVGEVESKGIELDLKGYVLEKKDLNWSITGTYAKTQSNVLTLSQGVDQVDIGGFSDAQVIAEKGNPIRQLRTSAYLRDPQGRVVVGADGNPIQDTKFKVQGQTNPTDILGLSTNFEYKNFSLYASGDYRTGHVFFNSLVNAMEFTGLTQHSASAGRKRFVFPNSSYLDANGNYVANTTRLTSSGGNAFWDSYNEVKENYVTDASAIKLREVSLAYKLANDFLKRAKVEDVQLGFYGRNLITLLPKDNVYTDPEFNFTTGNAQGIGTQSQTPPVRSFGMNLNINF